MYDGAKRCNIVINGSQSFENGGYTYYPYVMIDGIQYKPNSQVQVKKEIGRASCRERV